MPVVDASVIVKMYAKESGSDAALELIEQEYPCLTPAHAFAEVCEVLARKVRRGELTEIQLEDALKSMPRGIAVTSLDPLILPAARISLATGASVYDCLYIALAALEDRPLVTADQRLVDKMAGTEFAGLLMPLNSFNPSP